MPGPMMRHERGFSLVELMVAMTVTLIVSGAIYGLLTSGSNAFRREPELADRQQNIRAAMDLISRDVFNAGAALPTFSQVFTRNDPVGGACAGGLNGCGPLGTVGSDAADARGAGDPSENTDVLEIVSTDERCPQLSVCCTTAGCAAVVPGASTAQEITTREGVPLCLNQPGLALLTTVTATPANDWFVLHPAALSTATPADCTDGASRNGNLTLGPALAAWLPAAPIVPPVLRPEADDDRQVFLYRGRVVRYRIAPSTDPNDDAPTLWRSESGRYAADGSVTAEPHEAAFTLAGSPWELVARGIEDLQIEYQAATGAPPVAGAWDNQPPAVTSGDYNSLVRRVRITLSARATAPNLQGATTAAGVAVDAVRGQLSAVITPRAAFQELQMGSQIR